MTTRTSGVPLAAILPLVRDRKWHPFPELLAQLGPLIQAEVATRYLKVMRDRSRANGRNAVARSKNCRVEDIVGRPALLRHDTLITQIALGRSRIINIRLKQLCYGPPPWLEKRGTSKQTEYRLNSWYCASCGEWGPGDPPAQPFCDLCRKAGVVLVERST